MGCTCEQDVLQLEVAVDDERLLTVQVGQALAKLDAPAHPIRVAVHGLHRRGRWS